MPEETKSDRELAAGKLGALWCAFMHDSPTWPIHGQYRCRTCGRYYPVLWAADKLPPAPAGVIAARPAFRSALLPLLLVLAIMPVLTVRAAEISSVEPTASAARALARYTAGLEKSRPWSMETVEIDASLPKLEKQGRLLAIRRLRPLGQPEYQVLETVGDKTVRQQVIVRYLSAEARAASLPSSSVAITPANYKFRYKGCVNTGDSVAYVFLITPRRKREGLIKGELWLDGETGAAVLQSGYLVKKPSIFVKRVEVTRETVLHNGIAQMRTTHLSLDTRLVGRAELIIRERPCAAPNSGAAMHIAER